MPLEDLARQIVFKPLGMKSSSYVWRPDFEASTAIPYDKNIVPQPKKKRDAMAAYSLQTTAHDYALFLTALLNDRGLRPKALTLMETMQTQVPSDDCTVECFETPKTLALHLGWGLDIGLEGTAQGKALGTGG